MVNKTVLCEIFEKYGSDKCPSINHSYSPAYYKVLEKHRHEIQNVLEIGIGTNEVMNPIVGPTYNPGASLRSWAEFFPNAIVHGCDIDRSVLFTEPRIKCYYTDQSNSEALLQTINTISNDTGAKSFDFIIDDGSHIVDHMLLTFQTLKQFVSPGKFYIIEDIKWHDIHRFIQLTNNIENFAINYVHYGLCPWDSFVCYTRMS